VLVGDCMTRQVRSLGTATSVAEALEVMTDSDIHRMPVLDDCGTLVGIVSYMDLRIAEAAGRLGDPVQAVMTKRVVTVGEFCPIEEAAAVMRQRRVGGLPVMRGDSLIGIVTDGDIFDAFARLLGSGQAGMRLTLTLPDAQLALPDLLTEITKEGGHVISLGTLVRQQDCVVVVKVAGLTREQVERATGSVGVEISDILCEE
jgi:acetoin utilization protein AcuB